MLIRSKRARTLLACALLLALAGGLALHGLWISIPDPLPLVLARPSSPLLLDRDGRLIHARLSLDGEWRLPVPLAEMGHWLPKVLVAVEDRRFFSHPGIDFLALGRAAAQNILAGRVLSGASTISSQLVRLSSPSPRTFTAKAREFIGALKLERALSKEEILELYLNNAPFGGPIRGVEAAARLYFGKRAAELSLGEASLLVGLLKGPTAYRPDRNPAAALGRRRMIIAKVAGRAELPPDLVNMAFEEPLPRFSSLMPSRAWHFAEDAFRLLPPGGGAFRSSLDMAAQELLERSLQERLPGAGVTAAGVVIDNRDASILAYVGNARFDPRKGREWVDCAKAPRSPGSTLKPFAYLLALEAGRITPASLLADTQLQLGGEAPRNFNQRYRGPVSVHTALAESLNVPAVRVLRMVGVRRALNTLRGFGFNHLDRLDSDYGDSLVLGAGEVTLLELARAYTCLASLGIDRPLSPVRGGQGVGARLYAPGAAFLIAEILKDPARLPFLAQLTQARGGSLAAFKTGTSFGLRDAWTAAYSPRYTVVVWFGRADGGPDPRLVGISLAAPAAIRVLRELDSGASQAGTLAGTSDGPFSALARARGLRPPGPERLSGQGLGQDLSQASGQGPDLPSGALKRGWYAPPGDLSRFKVCALSGAALSPHCPSTRRVWGLANVWRTEPCALHTLKEGKVVLVWPPELEDFNRGRFAREDLSRTALIVSPMPGARYIITPGAKEQPLALKAEGAAYPVHWYVDGEYLGLQEREDLPVYWTLRDGEHQVSLLDAEERVSSASLSATDLGALRDETLRLEKSIQPLWD